MRTRAEQESDGGRAARARDDGGADGGPGDANGGGLSHGRRSTQRERILRAMLQLVAEVGFEEATIATVIARAGVSRPTFYEYFADKEACFLEVLRGAQQRLVQAVARAVREERPELAAATAAEALALFAQSEAEQAMIVANESLAGGRAARDMRDAGIVEMAGVVEEHYAGLDASTAVPDISTEMLLGGIQRLISARLRRTEPELELLARELAGWIDSYRTPFGEHRWRALVTFEVPARSPLLKPALQPAALSPGRPRLASGQVDEVHRQRILFAAAEVCERAGYQAATISEITRRAGVDARVFRELFASKTDLFVAVHEMHFQRVMALTGTAFFTAKGWPERVWDAGRAFATCVEASTTLAVVSFVESYEGGRDIQQRIDVVVSSFTLFLQEGYRFAPENPTPPSPLALEAIAATVFEIVYRHTRHSGDPPPPSLGLLPHVANLTLAPFLGAEQTNDFVARRLRAGRR